MSFPLGLLLCGIGACLLYVAAQGVDTASGAGVYQSLIEGMRGSRTESGTNLSDDDGGGGGGSAERPNIGSEGNLDGLIGMER